VAWVQKGRPGWTSPEFHIDFERSDRPVAGTTPGTPPAVVPIDLAVIAGTAARKRYVFSGVRIDLGRGTEVIDGGRRLIRTNHVAFLEGATDANQSVSRKHAHIMYLAKTAEYRLHDDGSAHGTALLRDGHTIPVPAGTRGTRLRSGDEIVLGQARIRVTIPNR
jgi:hypothetical protein